METQQARLHLALNLFTFYAPLLNQILNERALICLLLVVVYAWYCVTHLVSWSRTANVLLTLNLIAVVTTIGAYHVAVAGLAHRMSAEGAQSNLLLLRWFPVADLTYSYYYATQAPDEVLRGSRIVFLCALMIVLPCMTDGLLSPVVSNLLGGVATVVVTIGARILQQFIVDPAP